MAKKAVKKMPLVFLKPKKGAAAPKTPKPKVIITQTPNIPDDVLKSQDFAGLHDICPELVAVIDSKLRSEKAKDIKLGRLLGEVENAAAVAQSLVDAFGETATLAKIAKMTSDQLADHDVEN